MTAGWRRFENRVSGETFTFVETSEETGGARVVTLIEVQPGGGPETARPSPEGDIALVDGVVELLHEGRRRRPELAEPVTVPPGSLHAFTNPGDGTASVKVTVEPPMPRLVWNLLNGVLAPFGRRAADEALARYDRQHPSPGERVGELR